MCGTPESHSQHPQGKEDSPAAAPAAECSFPKVTRRELYEITERHQKGSSSKCNGKCCAAACEPAPGNALTNTWKCSDQHPVHTWWTLHPALALVSTYIIVSSWALLSPSSTETCLQQREQITEKKNQTEPKNDSSKMIRKENCREKQKQKPNSYQLKQC